MSPIADGAEVWKQIQHRLRDQLPRATYHTWVAQAEAVGLQDGQLTLAVGNAWARDRLVEIAPLQHAAREVLGRQARVAVIVPHDLENHAAQNNHPEAVTLQPVYRSTYDETVRPEQAIPLPRYYLRWLPVLGVDLAWIPVGFRQVAFFRGLGFEPGDAFRASLREIALWSGMSLSSLKRKVDDPRLGWFVRRAGAEPVWRLGPDGKPHREALDWQVEVSMPLTPGDQVSLEAFLRTRLAEGLNPAQAVQAAYQTPLNMLLPGPDPLDPPEMAEAPRSAQDVVQRALGKAAGQPGLRQAIDALAFLIAGYADPVYVGLHFLREELPQLGAGPGWFVQWLRALAADQHDHGQVLIHGGYPNIAASLGVTSRSVKRWMADVHSPGTDLSRFLSDPRILKHGDGSVELLLAIRPEDPLSVPAHGAGGQSELHSPDPEGYSEPYDGPPEGLSDPHSRRPGGQIEPHSQRPEGHPGPDGHLPRGRIGLISDEGANDPGRQVERIGQAAQRDNLTLLKGGGGRQQIDSNKEESSTSSDQPKLSPRGRRDPHEPPAWEMPHLLDCAGVHPAIRQKLRHASPVAWVSWLLYWASTLGQRLAEPTGNAVSRLKDDPHAAMGGPFERLASLGPGGLAELLVPRLINPWGIHPSNRDWEDVMGGAPEERLRRLVDLLGFDLQADREPKGLEDEDD